MKTTILLSTLSAALALSTMTAAEAAKTPPAPSADPAPAALPIPPPPPRVALDANGMPMPPPPTSPVRTTEVASVPSASSFAAVDRAGTGVVTKEQAAGDPWLSTNFARCDGDHNDEVTQAEYDACSTQLK